MQTFEQMKVRLIVKQLPNIIMLHKIICFHIKPYLLRIMKGEVKKELVSNFVSSGEFRRKMRTNGILEIKEVFV